MEKGNAVKSYDHVYYIDFLRIAASFLVIVNHTITGICFDYKPDSFEWYISALLFIICKTAVPIFLMITGSLLLHKSAQDYRKTVKRILRMLAVLIAWSYIYYCYEYKGIPTLKKTWDMLVNIFTNKPAITALWYLYALIGVYIMLPFISKMTLAFDDKDYLIFLGLWGLFNGLIPEIDALFGGKKITFVSYFQYQLFIGWPGYCVLGYYLSAGGRQILHTAKEGNTAKGSLLIKIALAFAALFFGFFSIIYTGKPNVVDNAKYFIFIILSALIYNGFVQAEDRFKKLLLPGGRFASAVKSVSEATFGIYLCHRLVRDILLNDLSISPQIRVLMDSVLGILLFDSILYFLCFTVISFLRRIPIVRKIV